MKKYIFGIFVIFLLSGCSFLPQSLNFYKPSYSQNATEEKLRSASRKWQKTPYVLGGTSRKGADCSGFTQTLMREFGILLPRMTKTQMASGIKVSKTKLRAGDLVFFKQAGDLMAYMWEFILVEMNLFIFQLKAEVRL